MLEERGSTPHDFWHNHRIQMQTHAGQEFRECPQKIGAADRSGIFRVIV